MGCACGLALVRPPTLSLSLTPPPRARASSLLLPPISSSQHSISNAVAAEPKPKPKPSSSSLLAVPNHLLLPFSSSPLLHLSSSTSPDAGGGGGNNNDDDNNGWWSSWWDPSDPDDCWWRSLFLALFLDTDTTALALLLSLLFIACLPSSALARTSSSPPGVWEVQGGKWTRLLPDPPKGDSFVVVGESSSSASSLEHLWRRCRDVFLRLMLPKGYPHSVSSDYLRYSLWRGVQGIASQISGVLSTQVP